MDQGINLVLPSEGNEMKINPNNITIISINESGKVLFNGRLVKEKNLVPSARIIILTPETSDKMKERGKATGVSAWFAKPISEKRMVVLINLLEKLKSENP